MLENRLNMNAIGNNGLIDQENKGNEGVQPIQEGKKKKKISKCR
jgi:hypothetical protein